MEKRKLKKMKVLEPSEEMVLAAESDIPAIGNTGGRCKALLHRGL